MTKDDRHPDWVRLSDEVKQALDMEKPTVALESTVITHGLPRPKNLRIANLLETTVRNSGAVPATIAVIAGEIRVGLGEGDLDRLALSEESIKISTRDLSRAVALRASGGTTVAATAFIAEVVGIRVFATGGIGGVHRGELGDVSADLGQLQRSQVAVVCAGAKSILDLPKTLEWLETNSIPVLGWQTDEFPAFYSRGSGLKLGMRVEAASEIAAILNAHWEMDLGGVLVCVPCPEDSALPEGVLETAIGVAMAQAEHAQIRGKALTPFLLNALSEATDGESLRANEALLLNNATIAAQIALALEQSERPRES